MTTNDQPSEALAQRIRRIEDGVLSAPVLQSREPEPVALAERMERLSVPGVSIAVINGSQIEWARGYGVRAAGRPNPVGTETLFQACSISKPVAVVAALRLVQEGRLDLDVDVNRYLTSWKVPANGLWQPAVTLRQLMCHGAGTTVHGFPGYNRRHAIPTLRQILDGAGPANTPPIRVNAVPGTQFRYSGGGTSVLQQVLMDVTGQPFAELMRELVLDPLGMRDSTYEQPLSEARWGAAASGHSTGGGTADGEWHVYPEQAAAGLWTTPSDLARLAIDVQRARAGVAGTLLTQETVNQMLTPQVEDHIGLGFWLEGKGPSLRFHHGGDNVGFKCVLVAYADQGLGAVVMMNGDEGSILHDEILRAIALEYDWPRSAEYGGRGFLAPERVRVAVPPHVYADYAGTYQLKPGFQLTVNAEGDALFVQPDGQAPIALHPLSETRYFAEVVDVEITFIKAEDGRVTGLTFRQNVCDLPARRCE